MISSETLWLSELCSCRLSPSCRFRQSRSQAGAGGLPAWAQGALHGLAAMGPGERIGKVAESWDLEPEKVI